jgi:Uma2 family endonuclease
MTFMHPTPYTLESELLESMTDEQFLRFCRDNPAMRFERTAGKKIVVMSPTGSESSFWNGELFFQLKQWDKENGLGKCFDSSGGFKLRDGSIKSPDIAWIANEKWDRISEKDRKVFAPICPEFVLELRSESDLLPPLLEKMKAWVANGVQLGFLIDPMEKVSYVFRGNGEVSKFDGFDRSLSGENTLPGFELDLRIFIS